MSDALSVSDRRATYQRCIDAARLALGRTDKLEAERALAEAVEASDGTAELQREHADALVRLGALYLEAGRLDDAETTLQRGLEASESHLGAGHPDLVVVLNELSMVHLKRSAYTKAEPLLVRLLALKRAKGENHPEVATVLSGLATVRERLGDHASAEKLYREALAIREDTLAPNHFAIASALEHVADTCAAHGRFAEALVLLRRALPMRELSLGVAHPSVRALRERISDFEMQESEEVLTVQARTPPRASTAVPGPMSSPAPAPGRTPPPLLLVAQQGAQHSREASAAWTHELQVMKREIGDVTIHTTPVERTLAIADTVNERLEQGSGKRVLLAGGVIAIALAAFAMAPALRSRSSLQLEDSGLRAQVVPPPVALRDSTAPITGAAAIDAPSTPSAPARSTSTTATAAVAPASTAAVTLQSRPRTTPDGKSTASPATEESVRVTAMQRAVLPKITVPTIDVVIRDPVTPAALRDSFTSRLSTSGARDERDASLADAVPKLIGSAPQPVFPPQLRERGVEGEVLVQFLVDEKGRVDPATMKVIRSPNAMLNTEVRKVLPQFRFEPARGTDTKPRAELVRYVFQFHASQP